MLSFACPISVFDAREDCQSCIQACNDVPVCEADAGRAVEGSGCRMRESRKRMERGCISNKILPWPCLAHGGNARHNQIRFNSFQARIRESPVRQNPRREIFNYDIADRYQFQQNFFCLGMVQIKADAPLVAVPGAEVRRVVALGSGCGALRLDFDHLRAEIAQNPRRVGSGKHAGEIKHADPAQDFSATGGRIARIIRAVQGRLRCRTRRSFSKPGGCARPATARVLAGAERRR